MRGAWRWDVSTVRGAGLLLSCLAGTSAERRVSVTVQPGVRVRPRRSSLQGAVPEPQEQDLLLWGPGGCRSAYASGKTQKTATAMEGGEWGGARAPGFRPRNYIAQKAVLHTLRSPEVGATLVPQCPLGNGVHCLRGTKLSGIVPRRRTFPRPTPGCSFVVVVVLLWEAGWLSRVPVRPSVRRSICPSALGSGPAPRPRPPGG